MSIKIIEKPSVYLVGRSSIPTFLAGSGVSFEDFLKDNECPDWTTDAYSPGEVLVEVSGRLCYQSFKTPRPGGNHAYIKHILEAGHGSVLEHATFSLIFTGVSRSLTHELVRHRAGMSYSQLSQRYVDESDAAFVEPPIIAEDPELHAAWMCSVQKSLDVYCLISDKLMHRMMVEDYENYKRLCVSSGRVSPGFLGWKLHLASEEKTSYRKKAREAARSVLNNSTETKIFVTGNGRSFRNFLEQRGSAFADAEIRRLALAVLPVLFDASPAIFGDYSVETTAEGIDHITTPHRKV